MAWRSAAPAPEDKKPVPNSMVASAKLLQATQLDNPVTQGWQEKAWEYWQSVGEFRRGIEWMARGCSRARLIAAERNPDGDEPTPVTDGLPAEVIEDLDVVCGGVSSLLEATAIYLSVPGIGFHVGWTDDDGEAHWEPHAAEELRVKGGRYELQTAVNNWLPLPDESLVVQIWRPDRRKAWEADSPARACLDDLREIQLVTKHIQAGLTSRLAGAGILFIPEEFVFPGDPDKEYGDEDPFVADLIETMVTPIMDPNSASAVVPLVVKVPGEYVDKIKHVTLQVPLDERALEQRDNAIKRLAVGLDIPAEVLTGMGDVNHWGQWQIEETAIKMHIEPMLQTICHGLTKGYLRPRLEAAGVDPSPYVVWYDASELHARPDISSQAFELYDRGELKGEALRRETGVSEDDKPEGVELAEWAWKKLVNNPDTAAAALAGLGIKVEVEREPVTEGVGAAPALPPVDNAPPPPPTENGPPEPDAAEAAAARAMAFQEACDGLVWRALETAGNRLRQHTRLKNDWPGATVHTRVSAAAAPGLRDGYLLANAFPRASEIARRYEVDEAQLVAVLTDYCSKLIYGMEPHDFDQLTSFMREQRWQTK